jgi:negative regulator of flagellin synthesis FlgM
MKIDNNLVGVRSVGAGGSRTEKGKSKGESRAAGTPGDSVNITSTTARLQALEAALADVEPQDLDKVDEIRRAIAEGRFQVDEDAVADGLIKETLELLRFGGR